MFKLKLWKAATAAAISIAFLIPMNANAVQERKFVFAHVVAPEFPYHTSAEEMKSEMERLTDGKWTMEIHHSGALGWEVDLLESLQFGEVDFTWVHTAAMATFEPSFDLFNLPFVFHSEEHIRQALDQLDFSRFYEEAEAEEFKLLGIGSPAFRYPMNAEKPITSVADFGDLRMRTMGVSAHVDTYEALGSTVANTAFSELYSALQMGAVDGNENALSALHAMRFHEVQEYLTLLPVVANIAVLVMSQSTWDSLSAEEQALVEELGQIAIAKNDNDYADMDQTALENMKEAGIKVNEVEDISEFVDATEPVRHAYISELDPWVQDLMDEILNLPAAQ